MKSKPKKYVPYSTIMEKLDLHDQSAPRVAKALGVSVSTVYAAKRKFLDSRGKTMKPRVEKRLPILSISLVLPGSPGSAAEVQVRNGVGGLLGTLRIESDGLGYRRPNQKTPADRQISWASLDKIMQLGIL